MAEAKTLSIGDRVQITKEGAHAHRHHHNNYVDAIAKISIPAVGAVAEAANQIVFTFPDSNCKGSIVEIKRRWWNQSGHD